MASPAATFLNAFQTMDSAQRGWAQQRLAESQFYQNLARSAVTMQKERKAQDFNEMVTMLKRDDDNRQFDDQNRRLWAAQNSQNVLGAYNAETSRMNAATSRYNQQIDARRYAQQRVINDDPLGLVPGSGTSMPASEPALPDIPGINDPDGTLFNFGGRGYGADWGPATATVFGGSNDPDDNGLSAFGGRTGAGGKEGVAIPAKVLQQVYGGTKKDWEGKPVEITLADGRKSVLPVVDLGTAERIWQREGRATVDLTPGAARSLGGDVIYDDAGNIRGVQGIQIGNVRLLDDRGNPSEVALPEPGMAAESNAMPPSAATSLPIEEWSGLVPDSGTVPVPNLFATGAISAASPVMPRSYDGTTAEDYAAFARGFASPSSTVPAPAVPYTDDTQMILPPEIPQDSVPSPDNILFQGAPDLPAPSVAEEPLLPPPSQGYQSFSGVDLTQGMSRQLRELSREAELYKQQEAEALRQSNQVRMLARTRKQPATQQAYIQEAQRLSNISRESGVRSSQLAALHDQLTTDADAVRKRQDKVSGLAVIDGVLPDQEVRALLADASDPTKGGLTDQRVKQLEQYNDVRQRNGLNYPSRGIRSAQEVTRTGMMLEEAKDAMKNFEKFQSLTEDLAAAGDDPRKQEKIQSEIRREKPGAERWQRLKTAFDQAVANDRMVVPRVDEVATEGVPAQPQDDLFGTPAKTQSPAPQSDSKTMSQADLQRWSTAKEDLRDRILGGRDAIKQLISRNGAGEMTLNRFKKLLRSQLRYLEPEDGEDFPSPGAGFQLPKNANSLDDVANALAEDLWRETGRKDDDKVALSPANVSADGRQKGSSILERFQKPATK